MSDKPPTPPTGRRAPYAIRLKLDCHGIPAGTVGTVVQEGKYNAKVEFTIGDTISNHYHREEMVYYGEMEALS